MQRETRTRLVMVVPGMLCSVRLEETGYGCASYAVQRETRTRLVMVVPRMLCSVRLQI